MDSPSTQRSIIHRIKRWRVRSGFRLRRFVHDRLPEYFPIAYKLSLIITLLISGGMIMLGLVIVTNQTELLRGQMDEFGQTMVNQVAESSKELVLSDDTLSLMVVISNLGTNENVLGASIYSDNGEVLASSGANPSGDIINLYGKSTHIGNNSYSVAWQSSRDAGTYTSALAFITPIRFQGVIAGHALVSFSEQALNESIQHTISAIAAATILMIILGIIIAFIMGDRLSRPIHQLMDASKAIGSGNYGYRIQERRNDEIGYLTSAFNDMAKGLLEKSQVENAFSRYVSPNVAKQILSNLDSVHLGGKHMEGSVLFADIVGFTSMSEKLPPDEVADLLNEYFSYISIVCQLYRGTIDKYMGDCAMIVFGIPDNDEEHKFNAIACAVMIQRLVETLNARRIRDGKYPIHFRIGVNSGVMLAGNMGSPERMQYTVVGEAVNLASRLHTVAEKGQIIITEPFYKDSDINWRLLAQKHKSIHLRGIAEPVSTYIVNDITQTYRTTMDAQLREILSGKSVA
ncbi:adenylate/guanylate cyclase domain-containing protein [Thiohalophilus sp.]|uniref:adenylate/guanylate cyclase domain-containing protein n=1 Tax=Thiohalophilus sp. TaxID=3028392 RepID=UPI0039769D19